MNLKLYFQTIWCCIVLLWHCVPAMAQWSPQNLPPKGFVYAQDGQFMLDGSPFYYAGTNVYDFFTYGASYGDPETQYMDKGRIDTHMRSLYENGIRVVRLWGFSHEEWHGFEPQKGVYNEPQFMLFDYILQSASANGLKLIIALENYWLDYGGIATRLEWEGINIAEHPEQGQFFTNEAAMQGYKDYVAYFVNRINHYDGIAYKDDPTIMAWELMNEPRYQGFGDDFSSNVLRAWVDDMGAFIKAMDPNHMLGTGLEGQGIKYGFGGDAGNDYIKIHQSPYIDFASAHPYIREHWADFDMQMTKDIIKKWATEARTILNKPLFVGEFNVEKVERIEWWTEMYQYMEDEGIGGTAFWWFPDEGGTRDKFAVFSGDPELDVYRRHAAHQEDLAGGEQVYVSMMSPRSGDNFLPGSNLTLQSNLTNANNSIASVAFYANGELLGSDTQAPYTFDWENLPTGEHVVEAKATNKFGESATSRAIKINVGYDNLYLEYKDASESVVATAIKPHFNIVNGLSQDIDLSDLSIRYWFTKEQGSSLNFMAEYSPIGSEKMKGTFNSLGDNLYEMIVGFNAGSGALSSRAQTGLLATKVATAEWAELDQSDDFSFKGTQKSFAQWDQVALYYQGQLVWGRTPDTPNDAPIALLNATPKSGKAPLAVAFDGSGSTDPNGDNLTYTWDLGNGATATGATLDYVYDEIGVYNAQLTVTDPDGNRGTAQVVITVTDPNEAPVAIAEADVTTGIAPLRINFDGSSSTDPNSDTLTHSWDFGTGDSVVGTTAAYTFTEVGEYTVTLTVSDGKKSSVATLQVTVTDGTPVAQFTTDNAAGVAPLTINMDASSSLNPADGPLTYAWDFGDGTSATGVTTQKTYDTAGVFDITLTVTNSLNKFSQAVKQITVTTSGGPCDFGTPLADALPTIENRSYNHVHVLGGAANILANMSNLTVNWNLTNNGLYQLSIQTTDGVPNWYNDLRANATHTFGEASPEIVFSNTGIAGLDGAYDVALDGENFVLVAKTGLYVLYFSNSATPPVGCTARVARIALTPEHSLPYPNPFTASFQMKGLANVVQVSLYNAMGNLVSTIGQESLHKEGFEMGSGLSPGAYVLRVTTADGQTQVYKVIKQ